MTAASKDYFEATDALKGDWSLLESLDVDSSKVIDRSRVYQRTLLKDDKEIPVYVKIYAYKKHAMQRILRRGRSRIEARNLFFFNEIGVPAARVIAWSERRSAIGRVVEEYIVTEAVEGAVPLDEFISEVCPNRDTAAYCKYRDSIIKQIGASTRAIHQHNFLHKDLKWRNVLGRLKNDQVELYWIDCPIGDFTTNSMRLKHGQLKDCATLDKLARITCSNDERKYFVASYLNAPTDSAEVEAMSRQIDQFRKKRFDQKDDMQAKEREKRRAKKK